MKRKLEVEALEDRVLATAGLHPLAAHGSFAGNSASDHAFVRAMTSADSAAAPAVSYLIMSSGSSGAHGGVHANHNETLVRDHRCRRRKRAAARR
jgi:hypothetical protein